MNRKNTLFATMLRFCLPCLMALLLLQGCSKNDDLAKMPSIGGHYRVVSVMADKEVDITKSGYTSDNLLEQLTINGPQFRISDVILEIRPNYYNRSDYTHKGLYAAFPHPNVHFYANPDGSVIIGSNGLNGGGYTYEFNEKTKAITIVRPANHAETEEQWGRLNTLLVLENNYLAADISKKYYDFATASWLMLNIKAVYKRIE
jgi:hypothetical protein